MTVRGEQGGDVRSSGTMLSISTDGGRGVELLGGDICQTFQTAEAIVVSDDNYLSHRGGVSRAVWRGIGAPLVEWKSRHDADSKTRPRVGEVLISRLDAPHGAVLFVLHAITLDFDEDSAVSPSSIGELYRNVFRALEACAADAGPLRVALPLLGTGAAGCSVEASFASLVETARTWARLPSRVTHVTVTDPNLRQVIADVAAGGERRQTTIARTAQPVPLGANLVGTPLGAAAALGAAKAIGTAALAFGLGPFGRLAGAALAAAGVGAGATAATPSEASEDSSPSPQTQAITSVLLDASEAMARRSPAAEWLVQCGSSPDEPSRIALELMRALEFGLEQMVPEASRRTFAGRLAELPGDVEPGVRVLLHAAAAVRNSLLHSVTLPTYDDLRVLLDATDAVLALAPDAAAREIDAVEATPPAEEAEVEAALTAPQVVADHATAEADTGTAASVDAHLAKFSPRSPASPTPAARLEETPRVATFSTAGDGGTRHVFALRDFLRSSLPAGELEALDRSLLEQGYKGNFDDRLLEYCVRLDDPGRKLASLFRETELRIALGRLSGKVPDPTLYADVLAQRILEHIGFPAATPLQGLAAVRVRFETARRRVGLLERAALVGEVVGLGVAMESLLLIVLRFHCVRATGHAPDPWWRTVPSRTPPTLEKPSLGTLVQAVQALDKEIRTASGVSHERYRQLFGTPALYAPVMRELPTLRNHFSHERSDDGGSPLPLADLRVYASSFIERGLEALTHLDAPMGEAGRVCPYLIRVERVVLDAWARRTIEATNDEGHHEVLFTEEDLRPGQVYLMTPLTNPLRVTPVLVQVGASLRSPVLT